MYYREGFQEYGNRMTILWLPGRLFSPIRSLCKGPGTVSGMTAKHRLNGKDFLYQDSCYHHS